MSHRYRCERQPSMILRGFQFLFGAFLSAVVIMLVLIGCVGAWWYYYG